MAKKPKPLLICDRCEEPATVLTAMDGVAEVLIDPKPSGVRQDLYDAQVRAAPRRPSRWCEGCRGGLVAWQNLADNARTRALYLAGGTI